jgi:hypothetical protein
MLEIISFRLKFTVTAYFQLKNLFLNLIYLKWFTTLCPLYASSFSNDKFQWFWLARTTFFCLFFSELVKQVLFWSYFFCKLVSLVLFASLYQVFLNTKVLNEVLMNIVLYQRQRCSVANSKGHTAPMFYYFFFPEALHMKGVVVDTSKGAHSIGNQEF